MNIDFHSDINERNEPSLCLLVFECTIIKPSFVGLTLNMFMKVEILASSTVNCSSWKISPNLVEKIWKKPKCLCMISILVFLWIGHIYFLLRKQIIKLNITETRHSTANTHIQLNKIKLIRFKKNTICCRSWSIDKIFGSKKNDRSLNFPFQLWQKTHPLVCKSWFRKFCISFEAQTVSVHW